jgi:hypothetical protein
MAKGNGSVGWIRLILYAAGLVAALAVAWGSLGHSVRDNTGFRLGDGAKNTQHRIEDEVDTQYIKRDISEIKATQHVILEEVRALK